MPKSDDERRNHDDAAADAEEPRGDADHEAERDHDHDRAGRRARRGRRRATGTTSSMRTATTTSRAMNIQRSHASGMRASSFAPSHPPTMPPAATNSAAITSTSPFTKYVIAPTTAVGTIAASDVADARRWSMWAKVMSSGHHEDAAADAERARQQAARRTDEREPHPRRSRGRWGERGGRSHPTYCTGGRLRGAIGSAARAGVMRRPACAPAPTSSTGGPARARPRRAGRRAHEPRMPRPRPRGAPCARRARGTRRARRRPCS